MKSDKVYTRHGVPISVTGIAQVCVGENSSRTIHSKLQCPWHVAISLTFSSCLHFQVKIQGQNKEMLATACQMFMGKSEGEIAQIALETLEGHQRAIIAHLTVEVCAKMAECQEIFFFFFLSVLQLRIFRLMLVICAPCNKDVSSCMWFVVLMRGLLVAAQEIYQDRKKFSEQVFKVASSDLVNMGIGVVSYTLKDVHDDQVLAVWTSYLSLSLAV